MSSEAKHFLTGSRNGEEDARFSKKFIRLSLSLIQVYVRFINVFYNEGFSFHHSTWNKSSLNKGSLQSAEELKGKVKNYFYI